MIRKYFVETPVESPSTGGHFNMSENDTSLQILDSGDEELLNIFQPVEMENIPKKLPRGLMGG